MSTTDTAAASGPPPSGPRTDRTLRRSRNGRVGAGVAAGLGDYFGLDPVLFRVLFATSAFFGGAGIIAYLIAWAAIPEEGARHAPVDSLIARLRRRNVPPWAMLVGAGAVLWLAAFSWWLPGPFVPVVIAVALLLVVYGRRNGPGNPPADLEHPADPTAGPAPSRVDLTKSAAGGSGTDAFTAWRAAARERRRRSFPLRIGALAVLAATLLVLGVVDAVHGIPLPVYFIVTGSVAVVALALGLALRRTPWTLAGLLVPAVVGLVAVGGTSARLHDGVGQRTWDPTSSPAGSYRLAFGRGTLDLRGLDPQLRPRTVYVTMGAGRITVLASKSLNLTVKSDVRIGRITVDGNYPDGDDGVDVRRTVRAPRGATGQPVTVIVRLASGRLDVDRR